MGAHTVTVRNTGGTDHLAFDGMGLPDFQFIQDPMDYGVRTHDQYRFIRKNSGGRYVKE